MRINRMRRVMLLLTIMLFSLMEAHAMWTYFIKETKTVDNITYNYWYKRYSGAIDSRRKVPFKGVGGVGDGASFAFLEVAPLAEDPYHYHGQIAITAQSIASGAFADCTALTSVSIPSNMGDGILMPAYIKSGAFSNCPALADVYTESECGIPSDAFDNYIYQHATLHVPQGKKQTYQSIEGWRNFVNIVEDTDESELQEGDTFTAKTAEGVDMEFTVKDKNTRTIWVGTFQRVAIPTETGGTITIPVKVDGWYVRGISTQAFSGCSFLGGITIPEGIEIIDDNAFYNCESLTSINIPKSVTSLGSYHPFIGCSSLHNVTVASGNTKYDSRNNCNGIIETATNKLIFGTAEMTIPSSVTSIAPAAFLYNSELTSIEIPEGVESIGQQAFMECCNLQRVEIPKTVTHLDKEIFANCYNLYQISVATNNPVYDSRDYCNAIIETATNTLVEGCYNTVIPASVKHIGECAFGGRQWLNSMKLPEGLISIGVNAFWLCTDLKEITIPANVQTIGDYAFEGCLGLQDVYSQIEDPFNINENVFNVTYEVQGDLLVPLSTNHFTTATLHVPAGSKSKYQSAAGWKNFQNIVEMEGENTLVSQITLNATSQLITQGQTFQLSATVSPSNATNKNVTWSSNNTSVATVNSNGLVTGVGVGNAVITCEAQDGSGVKTTCNVTIKVLATEITLNASNIVLTVGQTFQLTCTVVPSNATYDSLKWSSDNNSVATVTQFVPSSSSTTDGGCIFFVEGNPGGLVTAHAPGSATITCLIQDGSGVTATCNVTVKDSTEDIIQFADAEVKRICVENWDTNGDGELSLEEAAAITSLNTVFKSNRNITSFDELQYFTGLEELDYYEFYSCSNLESIIIPDNITTIKSYTFNECSSLTDIELPNSLVYLYDYAFTGCDGLTSVTIPKNVYAKSGMVYCSKPFSNCKNLAEIIVDPENPYLESIDNVLYTKDHKAIMQYPAGKRDTEFIIPEGVTYLAATFIGCEHLTSVKIPESVTLLNGPVFQGCTGLTEIEIPQNASFTGYYFIKGCTNLTQVISHIMEPEDVDNRTFEITNGVYPATLYVPAGTKSLYEQCEGWSEFQNIVEMGTLSGNIDFADAEVKRICVENWDTDGDGELSYEEAAAVTSIETVFRDNKTIESFAELEYFTGLTTINDWAFGSCSSLRTITFPSSLTSIGSFIFYGSKALTSITIPKSVTSIGDEMLVYTEGLGSIIVENGNTVYDSRNGCNAIIQTATNTLIAGCMNSTIPNSVTGIGKKAFALCSNLANISIPSSVKSIGEYAFQQCKSLSSITLPSGITRIEQGTFYVCSSLVTANIPNGVTVIGDRAFWGCGFINIELPTTLKTLSSSAFYQCKSLTSVDIPEGVTSIGSYAFGFCDALSSISIPKSVTSISQYAFRFCPSLTEVTSYINPPFNITDDVFEVYDDNYNIVFTPATLYVPTGTKTKYQATAGWMNFQNIVEMGADVVSGDANGDGTANVTDYMAIANYILGLNPTNFNVAAADVNGDNDVNVTDYVGVANIILYGNYQGPSVNSIMAFGADETLPWMEIGVTEDGKMNLLLHDAKPFSAFQMDVRLPEGVEIIDTNMAKDNQTKNLGFAKLQDGTWRLLYGTLDNKTVNLVGDNLLTLELASSQPNAGGLIIVDDIFVTDPYASTLQLNAVQSGLPMGINSLERGTVVDGDSYDLTGRKVNNGQLKKGVYIVNGKKLFVK